MKERIAIGRFLKPQAVEELHLFQIYSGNFDIDLYPQFFISYRGEYYPCSLTEVKVKNASKGIFSAHMQLEGENSLRFVQGELFVEELPYHILEEDEFFLHDLTGMRVFSEGEEIGEVKFAYEVAAKTIVEVELKEGYSSKKGKNLPKIVFLPLWDPFLIQIDSLNRIIEFCDIYDFL